MAHLTLEQRYTIQYLRSEGLTQSAIAEKIGKDKSVISREIRRNCDMRNGAYRADLAHRKYQERLEQKPKPHKFTEQIKETIHRLLEEDFSPKQIVGRCKFGGKKTALVMSRFTNMFGKINDTRVSSIYICTIEDVSIESEVPPKIRADEYETR